jgi:membrane protease YdiL (CAAX protease family)
MACPLAPVRWHTLAVRHRLRRALTLADSPIGRGLPRGVGIAFAICACLVLAIDLQLFGSGWFRTRLPITAATICIFLYLARDNLDALGVRLRPLPSLRFWLYVVVVLAVVFAVLIAVSAAVYIYVVDMPIKPVLPSGIFIWDAVVDAPVVEEATYRWVIVTGLVAVAPRWIVVVFSGATFAYLHFLYGNPAPDNFIGGYIFAWMYLRSGSILVPIAFHALGNGTLIVLNVIGFYVLA